MRARWTTAVAYRIRVAVSAEQQLTQFSARQQAIVLDAIKVQLRNEPFVEVADAAGEEAVVFMEKKRPIAMLVSLKKVDRESLALSTNPEFLRIIENARKEIRAGQSRSLEEVERKLRGVPPRQTSAPDRSSVTARKKRKTARSSRGV